MKHLKHLFTIFILLSISISSANAQEQIEISDIKMINLGDGQMYATRADSEETPINGKCRIITGYTTEYVDAEFKNGYPEGTWKYYKYDVIRQEINYKDGYKDGDLIDYYPDGSKKSVTPVTKGKGNGKLIDYYYGNEKIQKEKGMKNGIEDGFERQYDEKGNLVSELFFKDGYQDGKYFTTMNRGSNDEYVIRGTYANGKMTGDYTETFANGNIKQKGKYKDGKKDGVWETFKKNGSRSKPTEEYKDGDMIKKTSYYTTGSIEMIREYRNGRKHGIEKAYNLDGTLKFEKVYEDGEEIKKD